MIRRPPRSTLFPYTTPLPISCAPGSRNPKPSGRARAARGRGRAPGALAGAARLWPVGKRQHSTPCTLVRSEEHTSELQSRQYLVCRLLLEKKKKTINDHTAFK